jgi:hypothetical protein
LRSFAAQQRTAQEGIFRYDDKTDELLFVRNAG